jgi:purine-binding chemotaxis protein CheW
MKVQLAVFRVAEQTYAIDIMRIKEVINPVPITPVPRAPATLEGVIELRGQILAVMDLRKRFDRPATAATSSSKIILVKLPEGIVGLVVDGVREVVRIASEDIRSPPAGDFFTGVCRIGDDIVMILDIDRILSSEEKISIEGIQEAARR